VPGGGGDLVDDSIALRSFTGVIDIVDPDTVTLRGSKVYRIIDISRVCEFYIIRI